MISEEKIDKVVANLIKRGLIEKSGSFTDKGRDFTRKKSRNGWCVLKSDKSLWVPVVPKRLDEDGSLHYTSWDWRFKSADEIEPEEFKEFCDYFEIDNDDEWAELAKNITEIEDLYL